MHDSIVENKPHALFHRAKYNHRQRYWLFNRSFKIMAHESNFPKVKKKIGFMFFELGQPVWPLLDCRFKLHLAF